MPPTRSLLWPILGLAVSACAQPLPDIRTSSIGGRMLTYEVQGGYAVYQGDIILGTVDEVESVADGRRRRIGPLSSVIVSTREFRWPDGVMYYSIDSEIPRQERILDGIRHWNENTPLKILPRTSQENYVRFRYDPSTEYSCSSYLGMIGGAQAIMTTDSCSTGGVIHELGHAFGLEHEQIRADRNANITVLYQNIDKRYSSNFDQSLTGSRDAGYFDYDSIMIYGASGFSRNFLNTIESVPVGIPFGQRTGLSAGDIDAVSRLYDRIPASTTITTAPAGLAMTVDGEQTQSPRTYNWAPGSRHTISVEKSLTPSGADPRYVFARWTDGGDAAHTVTASADQTVFCAVFQRQHQFAVDVASGNGSATAFPPSSDTYYPERQPVQVTAAPAGDNQFVRWSGSTNVHANGSSLSSSPAVVQASSAGLSYMAMFSNAPLTTVDTNPRGPYVIVDGTTYRAPVRFAWAAGTTHTLSLTATQTDGNGARRFRFNSWEDGSTAASRTIVAGAGPAAYTAGFNMQYVLSTSATCSPRPCSAGHVMVSPSSPDGFYDAGASVQVSALPSGSNVLRYWMGDLADGSPTHELVMDQQRDITGYFGPALSFTALNSASYRATPAAAEIGFRIAPGELLTIFGTGIGPAAFTSGKVDQGALATTLEGTRVLIDGTPAPLVYADQNQLSAVVPAAILGKTSATIAIQRDGRQVGSSQTVSVGETAPALFTLDASGSGQVAALNQDYTVNSPSNPATPGSVVMLFVTGLGVPAQPVPDGKIMDASNLIRPAAPVYVRLDKLPTELQYFGSAPLMVNGVAQVNVFIPKELIGDPAVPIQLIAGAYASPPGTTLAVR